MARYGVALRDPWDRQHCWIESDAGTHGSRGFRAPRLGCSKVPPNIRCIVCFALCWSVCLPTLPCPAHLADDIWHVRLQPPDGSISGRTGRIRARASG